MPRYIDADLIEYKAIYVPMLDGVLVRTKQLNGFYAIKKDIEAIPTADVQEVRHGRWLFGRFGCRWCSECGECGLDTSELDAAGNYCPNCGAKMDLEPEERKKFDEQIH